jgi:putative ABC transport system substrate-binding protein
MRRREFIAGLSGALAAWPIAARAQQSAMPVIGFLNTQSPDGQLDRLGAFRLGLKENGYIEGENVAIDYRWAANRSEQLTALAVELVRRPVAVIVTAGGPRSAFAAKDATSTTPIVSITNEDPVRLGLVTSLARPGGNLTGVNIIIGELTAKRLDLLREMVPAASRAAVLVNPIDSTTTETTLRDVEAAASRIGLQIQILKASTIAEINTAFTVMARERLDALFVASDPFFNQRRVQIANLASHHSIPAAYGVREITEVGGLMSYGVSLTDAFRQMGSYAGRILKGAKPADMPVVQSTKFELVLNIQTAKMLGLTVPPTLLARADEVIE